LPIRARLSAVNVLLLAVILGALGAFLVLRLRSDLRSRIDDEVRASAATIAANYEHEGLSGFREISRAALPRGGSASQVLDPNGRVVIAYGRPVADAPMVTQPLRAAALAGRSELLEVGLGRSRRPYRVMAERVRRGRRAQLVVVASSLDEVHDAAERVLFLLLLAAPAALAAAGLVGWRLLRSALLPVQRMTEKAERIGIDRLDERLAAPNAADEIGRLAMTLNAMLDRLEKGVGAQRRLIADASHELRAPLAAMRAELEVSMRDSARSAEEREVMESVREEVLRMSRTVQNLLTLAQADEGRLGLVRTRIDLADAVADATRPLRALAATNGLVLRTGGMSCVVEADAEHLHQALTNLIENAIKFTPAGGLVTVESWQRDGEAGVTVSDTGPGVAPEARAHLFDRFYRVDSSRSRASGGSGLGLAICYEIAAAHGGRVWMEAADGRGSAFSIALPHHDGTSDEARDALASNGVLLDRSNPPQKGETWVSP
jgi:heavy metal sensor kinase